MIYLKNNPIGLDAVIHVIQNQLHDNLSLKWGVDLDSYPRCYTNYTENGTDIEHYTKKNDYETVLFAEKSKFFFTAEEEILKTGNLTFNTTAKLYFIVDLKKIKSLDHRADEEVISDIVNELESFSNISIKRIVRNKRNVFSNQMFRDLDNLEPYFVCLFDIDIIDYYINQRVCN